VNRTFTLVCGAIAAVLILGSIAASLIAPQNPYDLASLNVMDARLAPMSRGTQGMVYSLGTDDQGRDIFSGIAYGLRISLMVGFGGTLAAMIIGTLVGVLAAYFGKTADLILMRIVDLQLALPSILIAVTLIALFGNGIDKVIAAIVAVQWSYFARTARAAALSEMEKDYIRAARNLNFPRMRIIFHEVLPNIAGPLLVLFSIEMAGAIALEATLSFLGIGLPVTEPSLGLLIANGYQYLLSGEYWISIYPGLALFLLIITLNFFGEGLRGLKRAR
jgi:peptide/nickel transport system permease protein